MLNNPEFVRLFRTKLRGRTVIVLGVSACVVFGVLLAIMQYGITNQNDLYLAYFFTTIGIQCGVGSLYALILASQNITLEREKNTYDFQRLVAMGPWRLGAGKLMGCSCEAYVGIAVGALFAFVPVLAGVIPAHIWFQSQVVTLVFTTMVASFGLLASSMTAKTAHASGIVVFLMLGMLSTIGVGLARRGNAVWFTANPSRVFAEFYMSITQRNYVAPSFTFFGGWIPLMAGFLLINLSATALFFVLTVRRLIDEELSFLRPLHALAAFVVFETLLIGGCWDMYSFPSRQAEMLAIFHGVNAVILMGLAFGLTSSAELLRGRITRGAPNGHWCIVFERTNPLQDSPPVMIMILFGAAYAVLAFVLTASVGKLTGPAIAAIVMVVAMGIAAASLLFYINLFAEKSGLRIGAAIIGVALSVPPMFVSYFLLEKISAINPFAWLAQFSDGVEMNRAFAGIRVEDLPSPFACPALCVMLAVLLTVLSAMRVRFLLDVDHAQRQRDQTARDEKRQTDPTVQRVEAARALLDEKMAPLGSNSAQDEKQAG